MRGGCDPYVDFLWERSIIKVRNEKERIGDYD
jgi:hypothetical protein